MEEKLPPMPEPHWAANYRGVLPEGAFTAAHLREYGRACFEAGMSTLRPLLAHAVSEADGWHDESRGGPIKGDAVMDAARSAIRQHSERKDGDIAEAMQEVGRRIGH